MVSVRRTAGKDDEMRVHRLGDTRVRRFGDMRVRRFGDNGLVGILIVELKAVAISVLSPVAVATPSRP